MRLSLGIKQQQILMLHRALARDTHHLPIDTLITPRKPSPFPLGYWHPFLGTGANFLASKDLLTTSRGSRPLRFKDIGSFVVRKGKPSLSAYDRAALFSASNVWRFDACWRSTASVNSSHVLDINGTGGNDTIVVNKLSNGKVSVSGVSTQFSTGTSSGKFNKISINAGNGTMSLTSTTTSPTPAP